MIRLFSAVLLLLTACVNEPCLNIAELNKQLEMIQQWQVEDSISSKTIIDSYSMSQTLIKGDKYSNFYDKTIQDDCGNSFGSWYYSIQYKTSFSLIHFTIDISGSGIEEDGFKLKLTITKSSPFLSKSTTYDFIAQKSRENNAMITHLEELMVFDKEYKDVLEITFKETLSTTDVKTVYYVKGIGIIKFELANGNIFSII